MKKNKAWMIKEVNMLRELYKTHTQKEIANILGLTPGQVCGALKRYKILSGRTGRFEKGMKPFNYGRKGVIPEKCLRTAFKKGHLPHNTLRDGYISIRTDKSNRPYKYVRIAQGKWELLHRHIWKKMFGAIPVGYIVVFKDSNTLNCDPGNLELITRAENARRNVNRVKATESLKKLYKRERLRKIYGLSPISNLRVVNY